MVDRYTEFNETTDLYLELLQEAQEIEDKKLIELIRNRLRQMHQPVYATPDGCQIILFPKLLIPSCTILKESRFWPKQALAHICIMVSAYLLMLTGHTLVW